MIKLKAKELEGIKFYNVWQGHPNEYYKIGKVHDEDTCELYILENGVYIFEDEAYDIRIILDSFYEECDWIPYNILLPAYLKLKSLFI